MDSKKVKELLFLERYRSIISLKHVAQAAGLRTIGRQSLLITPEFGSMIWLGLFYVMQSLNQIKH